MGALVLRKSGVGVSEGTSIFRLKWERISGGMLFFLAVWGLLAGIASDSAVEWEFCPIERQGRFAAAGCGKRAWWGRIRFLSGEAQMEWGIASTAELGFARQVGKELFLAADSFHVGSARGSGESAGVGLTRPWSGAVSCRSGAGAALERRGFRAGRFPLAWDRPVLGAVRLVKWGFESCLEGNFLCRVGTTVRLGGEFRCQVGEAPSEGPSSSQAGSPGMRRMTETS